jgi:hypothetical protein
MRSVSVLSWYDNQPFSSLSDPGDASDLIAGGLPALLLKLAFPRSASFINILGMPHNLSRHRYVKRFVPCYARKSMKYDVFSPALVKMSIALQIRSQARDTTPANASKRYAEYDQRH